MSTYNTYLIQKTDPADFHKTRFFGWFFRRSLDDETAWFPVALALNQPSDSLLQVTQYHLTSPTYQQPIWLAPAHPNAAPAKASHRWGGILIFVSKPHHQLLFPTWPSCQFCFNPLRKTRHSISPEEKKHVCYTQITQTLTLALIRMPISWILIFPNESWSVYSPKKSVATASCSHCSLRQATPVQSWMLASKRKASAPRAFSETWMGP